MLDQHDLEQHHRVNAGPAVVLAIQILHKFVDFLEVDGCVNLAQQVILRDHVLQTYKFQLLSIFCVLYQHFYHPTPLYRIFSLNTRKRPPKGDLFRQAESPCKAGAFLLCAHGAGPVSRPRRRPGACAACGRWRRACAAPFRAWARRTAGPRPPRRSARPSRPRPSALQTGPPRAVC